jgi:hypothetical protein
MADGAKAPGLIESDKPHTVWAPLDVDALTEEEGENS